MLEVTLQAIVKQSKQGDRQCQNSIYCYFELTVLVILPLFYHQFINLGMEIVNVAHRLLI